MGKIKKTICFYTSAPLLLSAILFGKGFIYAADDILLTRQAEAYFEAGDFAKARELYEKLIGEKLETWQQGRLQYNIGTTYLEGRDWEQTAEEYDDIPKSHEKTYLLNRALNTNRAVLAYREGLEWRGQQNLTLENYSRAFFLFREALRRIQQAQTARCNYALFTGSKECFPAVDLQLLRAAVKRELAVVFEKYGEAKIAESPPKEGIPHLLAGLKLVLSHLKFLEGKKLDENIRKNYLNFFTKDAESWLAVWDAQREKLEKTQEAYEDYVLGIELMKNDEIEESRIAFLNSEALLSALAKKIWGEDPLVTMAQRLLQAYQNALDQIPIQLPAIYVIVTEQSRMLEIEPDIGPLNEALKTSTEYLQQGLEYAKQGKSPYARFYLEEARQWIRRLLRQKATVDATPQTILEEGIEDQAHALELHRLEKLFSEDTSEVRTIRNSSQALTNQTVKPFIASVLQKENKEYPLECQCKPWNKVIPLFEKGRAAAVRALALLEKGKHLPLAMESQDKALRYWKEALEKMKHPEEDKKEKPLEKEPPPEEPEDEAPQIQEVLRLLQMMDQDDRRPEPQETTPQKGQRPW